MNHYYIHVMEPSPFAYLAIPSANRLGKLTPGLSHTVHMPSHIYLRTGNYATGVSVNIEAVKKYKQILPLYSPVQNSDFLYIIHNLHMQVNNAMLGGRYAHSAQTSQDLLKSIRPDYLSIPGPMGNLVQYVYMTPTLVDVRFGKWDKLLTAAAPSESMKYATILYRFGKGMALANSSRINEAKEELLSMQMLMRDSSLYEPFTPFSPAIDGAAVAESLLSGTIALQQKKWEEAVTAFELAVSVEENMVYNEPRDWLINPKPYLGNTLLKMGKTSQAKEVFEKDLLTNKENGWSLYGIYQALSVEKRKTESLKMLARFKKAFALSDSRLVAAVY